jgi:hypothetical protein
MLYWAEGARRKNAVTFTNSDPCMLALFLKFLEECYDVEKHRVAFSCNCFLNNGLALEEIEGWWLERLDLPRACLRRATVNTPSSAGRAGKRTLLYGTARLAVHSTDRAEHLRGDSGVRRDRNGPIGWTALLACRCRESKVRPRMDHGVWP